MLTRIKSTSFTSFSGIHGRIRKSTRKKGAGPGPALIQIKIFTEKGVAAVVTELDFNKLLGLYIKRDTGGGKTPVNHLGWLNMCCPVLQILTLFQTK